MTDIVERLREQPTMSVFANIGDLVGRLNHEREEAAYEIERLRGVFNKMADVLTNKELTDWQILEQIEDLTRAELWR